MNDMTLKRMRHEAIYACYKEGLEGGQFNSWRDAGEWVRKHPAPSYFVSAKLASRHVGYILGKTSLLFFSDSSRQMAWDLYTRYMAYKASHPGCRLSRERILEEIVTEPAPQFYLSAESIRKIIKSENDKVRRKWQREDI